MKQSILTFISALAMLLSGYALVKEAPSAMQTLPPLPKLKYIDPSDVIHQLPRNKQIEMLNSR